MEDIVVKPLYNNELEKRRYCHTIYLVYCDKNYRPYCVEHFIEYVRGHQLDRSASPSIYIRLDYVCFRLRVMFYRVGVREACETDRCEFGLRGGGLCNHAWFVVWLGSLGRTVRIRYNESL